ncbi:MAG: ATP phosphoribosyltransferase [Pseudomonadota bacterium]|jgi:ATP phosphoribosyltransferase
MSMVRLAIQKSGRLTEASRTLIAECGIELEPMGASLRAQAFNFPLEVLFLRDDDIPGYVADGVVDAAIVGRNVLIERGSQADIVRELGFGRCRLSIAVPKSFHYDSIHSLDGARIATSYPRILGEFLARNSVRASIHEITGSVEIAPSLGLGEAICDLVSSGSTLLANGLKEVETVLESQSLLIARSELAPAQREIVMRFASRIDAVLRAKRTKYITLNAPNEAIPEIVKLLPGLKSPSILPLHNQGWSSLHTVVDEDDFWNLTEKLKAFGAQGILVLPIEKVIA